MSGPTLAALSIDILMLVAEIAAHMVETGHSIWSAVRFRTGSGERTFSELITIARAVGVRFSDDEIQWEREGASAFGRKVNRLRIKFPTRGAGIKPAPIESPLVIRAFKRTQ